MAGLVKRGHRFATRSERIRHKRPPALGDGTDVMRSGSSPTGYIPALPVPRSGLTTRMPKGVTLWFTGLSRSRKTTVATRVHELLHERHNHAERLDGDVVRRSLKGDGGSSENDRDKNGERGTLVATLLTQNGVVALTACISPHRRDAFRC